MTAQWRLALRVLGGALLATAVFGWKGLGGFGVATLLWAFSAGEG